MRIRYSMLTILVVSGAAGALAGGWAKDMVSKLRSRNRSGIGLVVRGDEVFDFGNVYQNESLTHVFTVANSAKSDIRIVEYRSSCSCTVLADVKGLVLHSGDSLQLPVSIKTGAGEGRIDSLVSLYCQSSSEEDTKEGSITLGVKGTIVPAYSVRPTLIDFGEVHSPKPVRRVARLRANADRSVRILKIESNNKAFAGALVAATPGEDDPYIEVTFSGGDTLATRFVNGTITIHTNSKKLPSTTILCKAKFIPPVQVSPSSIVVDFDRRGDITERITVRTTEVSEISVDTREPYISLISRNSDEESRLHQIDVVLRDSNSQGFTSNVRIAVKYLHGTVGTEAATVEIPVHRLAQRKGVGR